MKAALPSRRAAGSGAGCAALSLGLFLAACSQDPAAGPVADAGAGEGADASAALADAAVPPDAAVSPLADAGDAGAPGEDAAAPACEGCEPQGEVAQPTHLVVARRAVDSLEIAWDEPLAQELGTLVVLSDAAGAVELSRAELPAGTRRQRFDQLAAGTAYQVRIAEFALSATCLDGACETARIEGPEASARVETAPDLDADGLDDDAELALATALRPLLLMSWQVSDVDQFLPSSGWSLPVRVTDRSAASAHPEALCPAGARCLEIFYGLAYANDCGAYPEGGCGGLTGHLGDSEYIYVLVQADDADGLALEHPERFGVTYGFYSAHSGAVSDSSTILRFGTGSAWPIVWVAQGKHANYATGQQCSEGAYYQDQCAAGPGPLIEVRDAMVGHLVNVGEPEHPLPVLLFNPSTGVQDYDVWSSDPFGTSESPGYQAVLGCVVDWAGTTGASGTSWKKLPVGALDGSYPGEASDRLYTSLGLKMVHTLTCLP